jgi:hypothetical protein
MRHLEIVFIASRPDEQVPAMSCYRTLVTGKNARFTVWKISRRQQLTQPENSPRHYADK